MVSRVSPTKRTSYRNFAAVAWVLENRGYRKTRSTENRNHILRVLRVLLPIWIFIWILLGYLNGFLHIITIILALGLTVLLCTHVFIARALPIGSLLLEPFIAFMATGGMLCISMLHYLQYCELEDTFKG